MTQLANSIPIYPGRRWPVGLRNAAKRLGVTQGHLHQVLSGARKSARLLARYMALIPEVEAQKRTV